MSHIFYKFKSAKDYDSYKFEGVGIPVWELKREIVIAKKLGKSTDFDLIITNAQNNEDFTDDMTVIPRNAQIIVKRVPVVGGRRPAYLQQGGQGKGPSAVSSTTRPSFRATAPSNPSNPSMSVGSDEESRIRAMMMATSSHWEQNQQAMPMQQQGPRKLFRPTNFATRGISNTPPDTYVCYRCGQKGHYIQNCPTNTDPNYDRTRIRKTTGIPRSFLKPAAAQPDSSANFLVTPEGNLVIATPNDREWDRIAKIRSLAETAASIPLEEIPVDLLCSMGGHILSEAVRMPCCGALVCDECARNLFEGSVALTTSDSTITCPKCRQEKISQENLVPDIDARDKVQRLLESRSKFEVPADGEIEAIDEEGAISGLAANEEITKKGDEGAPPFPFGFPPFPFMFPPPLPGVIPPFMPPPPFMPQRPFANSGDRREYKLSPRSQSRSRSPPHPQHYQARDRARDRSRSRSP